LSGLQKLEQRAKKRNELRGEYIKKIPSLFAVVCVLPGRAKDLSELQVCSIGAICCICSANSIKMMKYIFSYNKKLVLLILFTAIPHSVHEEHLVF
jgi:hypothetical protein